MLYSFGMFVLVVFFCQECRCSWERGGKECVFLFLLVVFRCVCVFLFFCSISFCCFVCFFFPDPTEHPFFLLCVWVGFYFS